VADAMMDIEDLVAGIGLPIPEADIEESNYRTLGGLILHHLGHVPAEGESFEFAGHQFQVIDMDRHRIDKVVIRPLPAALTAP
jgi:putative hemolysin